MADRDPRAIYYQCTGCGRTAISFDKPFPEICAECRVIRLLNDRHESKPLTVEKIDEMDRQLRQIIDSICSSKEQKSMITVEELTKAHEFCTNNRNMQGLCGCFQCEKTFDASEITEWIDDDSTAICPKCSIDSVIPGNKVRIDAEFLGAMYEYWFSVQP